MSCRRSITGRAAALATDLAYCFSLANLVTVGLQQDDLESATALLAMAQEPYTGISQILTHFPEIDIPGDLRQEALDLGILLEQLQKAVQEDSPGAPLP